MNYWSMKRQLQRADCRFLCSVYCFRKLVFSTWIILTIVLKQSSEIIILKCFRTASFRLKSAKIFLGEGKPLPQTPHPQGAFSASLRRLQRRLLCFCPPPNQILKRRPWIACSQIASPEA